MGINLDWQVESEQTHMQATEDPEAKYRRRRARLRLLLLMAVVGGVLLVIVGLILWRLGQVEDQYRQDLLDTVEAEVVALRVGNFANYMAVKRSASDAFMLEQSRQYEEYQRLKETHRVELRGEVVSVTIDNLRARVVVKEEIDGVPYKVVWFYWYYEDTGEGGDQGGWRRVPDDLTFWGDEHRLTRGPVRIQYHEMDTDLAKALAPKLEGWWTQGCQVLQCITAPPTLTVDIVAERPSAVEWASYDPWTLRVTSPLVGRARADTPLSVELEQAIAQQIASRLVRFSAGDVPPLAYSDAAWWYAEISRWLSETLLTGGVPTNPGFTGSLIAQFGPGAPGAILRAVGTDSRLDDTIPYVTATSLGQMTVEQLNALDWRGFFQWRLELEMRLLAQPDSSGAFLALYDLEDPVTATQAQVRSQDATYAAQPIPQVSTVVIAREESGTYAYVEASTTINEQATPLTVIWRLTGGTWKRRVTG